MTYENVVPSDLGGIASALLEAFATTNVWLFYGELGAGKTTLIKEILQLLKTEEPGSSPSFSIVNEYFSPELGSIFHFDFYRIEDQREAMDIGCEEYFYSQALCLVEWPERIPDLLPEKSLKVHISMREDQRAITVKA